MMGQTITTTQFYLYGRKYFTRNGYLKSKKSYIMPVQDKANLKIEEPGSDDVNLTDKVIVVTGANSGIGKEIATYAAAKGAKVFMLCRSKSRAYTARDEIVSLTRNDNVKVLLADLAEFQQVRNVAKELQTCVEKVDCLVCNAGVLLNDRRETSEGNEVTISCHLIGGSYLLSTLLLNQLKAAGRESRVVFVSSGGMYNTKFPKWDIAMSTDNYKQKYDGNMAYAYAKRGQVLLAERLTRDYPDICWLSAHPGWCDTPAVDEAYGTSKKYLEPMRKTWEGAEGISWLMSSKRDFLKSGEFYLDRQIQRKHLAGPFMTQGSFTKNTESEVDILMEMLKKTCP